MTLLCIKIESDKLWATGDALDSPQELYLPGATYDEVLEFLEEFVERGKAIEISEHVECARST